MKRAACAVSLGLSLGLAGCAGLNDRTNLEPPKLPKGTPQWEQFCTYNAAANLDELNTWLHSMGEGGWQLVEITGRMGSIYCFKAPVETAH